MLLQILVICALALGSFIPSIARAADSPKKFEIGVILPLSGDAASVGEAIKNGITIAQDKLSPKIKEIIELHYEDDQLNAVKSVSAFRKLVNFEKVDLVINASSGTGNALAPLAEQAKIPLIAIASDPKIVQGREYVVNLWVTPEEEARVAYEEIKRLNYKRLARIAYFQDGVLSINQAFDSFNSSVELVIDEQFPPNERDFRAFITKVRHTPEIDAVMVLLLQGQLSAFAKQYQQAGLKPPVFGFEMFEDKNEVEASGEALVGTWYVNAGDADSGFVEAFEARFPKSSFWAAPNGHDALLLVAAALEKSADKDEVNRFLHNVKNFKGALGTFSSTDKNTFTLPAAVKVVTEDGFKTIR